MPAMNRYLVRQRRPMWVCFVQEVEAEDIEAAERSFRDRFKPDRAYIEGELRHLDRGPVAVFPREDFVSLREVVDAD